MTRLETLRANEARNVRVLEQLSRTNYPEDFLVGWIQSACKMPYSPEDKVAEVEYIHGLYDVDRKTRQGQIVKIVNESIQKETT